MMDADSLTITFLIFLAVAVLVAYAATRIRSQPGTGHLARCGTAVRHHDLGHLSTDERPLCR
jgi:hypothetical protein